MENDVPKMTAITSLLGDQSRGDQLQDSPPPQKENKQQNLSQLPNGLDSTDKSFTVLHKRMKSDHHIAN